MWAVKIFDDEPDEWSASVLRMAASHGAGVELAFYGSKGFGPLTMKLLRERGGRGVGVHLTHSKFSLLDLIQSPQNSEASSQDFAKAWPAPAQEAPWARLAREAASSRELGNGACVIHLGRSHSEQENFWRRADPARLATESAPVIEACARLGVRLCMEKTYETLGWLRAYYARLTAMGLAGAFGFTLDIGHTRVFERSPLPAWVDFAQELKEQGYALHFHLHGNEGGSDRHEPLPWAHAAGWLEPSVDWAPEGALAELIRIHKLFDGQALLVLESQTKAAEESLNFAKFVTEP